MEQNESKGMLLSGSGSNFSIEPRHLGISQRRAEWFMKWARETADSEYIHLAKFEEGLGRIMFVAGALELERPLPRTLVQVHGPPPPGSRRHGFQLTSVSSFVTSQTKSLGRGTTTVQRPWKAHWRHQEFMHWPAARGQESEVGSPDVLKMVLLILLGHSWFSLEIVEEDWPWIFANDRKAALVISTLEALAVLAALKLQFGEIPGRR